MKNQSPLWLLSLLFFCFNSHLQAQEKGLVIFLIKPYDALIKIDDTVYDLANEAFPFELELPVGKYEAQIWAANFEILKIALDVEVNRPIQIVRQLQDFTEEYEAFQLEYEAYNTNKWTDRFLIAANVGATAGYALLINKSKNDLDNLIGTTEDARVDYSASVTEFNLTNTRNGFNFQRDKFDKKQKNHNNTVVIGGITLGVLYGLTVRYLMRRKQTQKKQPTYQPKNPFTNLSFELDSGLANHNQFSPTALTLKWSF